jgi:hypothetical protein
MQMIKEGKSHESKEIQKKLDDSRAKQQTQLKRISELEQQIIEERNHFSKRL